MEIKWNYPLYQTPSRQPPRTHRSCHRTNPEIWTADLCNFEELFEIENDLQNEWDQLRYTPDSTRFHWKFTDSNFDNRAKNYELRNITCSSLFPATQSEVREFIWHSKRYPILAHNIPIRSLSSLESFKNIKQEKLPTDWEHFTTEKNCLLKFSDSQLWWV